MTLFAHLMNVTATFTDSCISMRSEPSILLVDDQWGRADDPMIPGRYGHLPFRWRLESAEESPGVYSAKNALKRIRKEQAALVLLDVMFGGEQSRLGVEILEGIRAEFPAIPVIIFTSLESEQNRELVVRCMELGANEYLEKAPSPIRMQELLSAYTDPYSDQALYGNSAPIRVLRAKIARVAFSGETSVLIVGESGTGKELVAHALHRQGPHKQGPFVAKNCAHSDLHLLDSELFGHEKGAFTGAVTQRRGLIEEANGGMLFLDEIADMPLELQAKLLRTLESRTFRRVGGSHELHSRFQLVCATNRKPAELLKTARLREDFYYRIATMTLLVPPLRERGDDVPILADLFLKRFKARGGASYSGESFSDGFSNRLQRHSWPGNVRELRNAVERAVILSRDTVIGVEEFQEPLLHTASAEQSSNRDQELGEAQLPDDCDSWPTARLLAELRFALEVRRRVQEYKGNQWKAEFMRLLYPDCKAANAKGFDDLIKRLTQGPWGCPRWQECPEMASLIGKLRN